MKRRFIAFLCTLALLLPTVATAIAEAEQPKKREFIYDSPYEYTITVESKQWKNFTTTAQRFEALSVPEETLYGMTTEALLDTLCKNPLMSGIHAYEDYRDGFLWLLRNTDTLQELVKREDSADALIAKFYSIPDDEIITESENFLWEVSIGILLAQPEFTMKMSTKQMDELITAMEKKQNIPQQRYIADEFINSIENADYENPLAERLNAASTSLGRNAAQMSALLAASPVKTPKGSDVPVIEGNAQNDPCKTDPTYYTNYIAAKHNEWQKTWPTITRIADYSYAYNCHSYAWHLQSTSNPYWMNDSSAKIYMTDGSYVWVTTPSTGDRVYYKGVHTGVITGGTTRVTSKWAHYGLFSHNILDCPYAGGVVIEYWHR